MSYGSPWSEAFVRQLEDKDVRDEFVADQVRARVAQLIRTLREQPERHWTQAELAERASTTQNVISRFEDPNYGKMSLKSLLEIAAALDVPVWIDFPEWNDWLELIRSFPDSSTTRSSFHVEQIFDQAQAPVALSGAAASAAQAIQNMLTSQAQMSSVVRTAVNENSSMQNRAAQMPVHPEDIDLRASKGIAA